MNAAIPRALRVLAILIAVAAVLDPAITTRRAQKPDIAVLAASPSDEATASRVAHALRHRFATIRAPFAAAAATIVVGDRAPATMTAMSTPVFAVLPDSTDPRIVIEAASAPARPAMNAAVPITVRTNVRNARGRTLEVALRNGDVLLDSARVAVRANDTTISHTLSYVPSHAGADALRVTASLSGAGASDDAEIVSDVQDRRWHVLFYDAVPAWQSTFLRRSLERDARFSVTSRIAVSRGISTRGGDAPAGIATAGALDPYEVVVVGVPALLGATDVAALELFMRRRGGVVLLLREGSARMPADALLDATTWRASMTAQPQPIRSVASDSVVMLAADVTTPVALPTGSRTIARTVDGQPVVWDVPHGAGRLMVSGAADAWRFRDPARSAFDAFWPALLASAAQDVPDPIELRVSHDVAAPHADVAVDITTRAGITTLSAVLTREDRANRDGTDGSSAREPRGARAPVALTLLPDARPGEWHTTFRAPADTGIYRITVRSGNDSAVASIVVIPNPSIAAPRANDLLRAQAAATGGAVVHASQIQDLPALLARRVPLTKMVETWHPMRSPWWILPFAIALAVEWYWRRRRGRA